MTRRQGAVPRLTGLAALNAYLLFARDAVLCMQRLSQRHGPLVGIGQVLPLGRDKVHYLASAPEYARRVLSDPETFHTVGLVARGPRGSAQRRLRRGIVSMNGPAHRHYRRLLAPPLRKAAVEAHAPGIAAAVASELDGWPVGQEADLFALCRGLLRRIALSQLFAAGDAAEACRVSDMINEHLRMNTSKGVLACPVNLPGTPFRGMLRYAERVETAVLAWAAQRQGQPRSDDLLSLVVNAPDETGRPIGQEAIAGHVPTLFGAAYETCQSALFWCLLLLHQHPAVAAALAEALRDEEDPALLDQVVREAMRVLPPVPFQIRRASRDNELLGCPMTDGDRVFLSILLINRDPETWEEARCFRPGRWAGRDPLAYDYPVFSAGPRVCIGALFARAALKESLRQILRRFRLAIRPGTRIDRRISVTMAPSRAIPTLLHPADGAFAAAPLTGNMMDLVDWRASARAAP